MQAKATSRAARKIYLRHPSATYLPDIRKWLDDVGEILQTDSSWAEWNLDSDCYSKDNSIEIPPLFAKVKETPGPIVLVERVRQISLGKLRGKLSRHAIVLVRTIVDSTDLLGVLEESRERHLAGEPLLSRKLVAAILIVRKLKKMNMWAGNSKGYLWNYNLAKGKGVDVSFADIAGEVANLLLLNGVLVHKTSGGQAKYALNPSLKPEIHRLADDAAFESFPDLESVLLRDKRTESVNWLR